MTETNIACPVDLDQVDHNTIRITGLLTIALLAAYAITGLAGFVIALALDYTIRAWVGRTSPMQHAAGRLARALGTPVRMKDKAPKRFAARIGWLFAVAASALAFVHPTAGVIVGLSLLGFNVLDSVFDFCVGCWTYHRIVVPFFPRLARF